MNYLFIIDLYNLSLIYCFALYDVIHGRTLRHINDDDAYCAMTAITEILAPGIEKVKNSAKSDNLINKSILAI